MLFQHFIHQALKAARRRVEDGVLACVGRDRSAWAHVFTATLDRDELIGRRLEAVAEKLCGGSLTPLFTNLVRSKRLTPRERREIRKLMEELDL